MNFYFYNHFSDVSFVWLILSYQPALIIVHPVLCLYGFTTILEAKNVAHKNLYLHLHGLIQQILFPSNFLTNYRLDIYQLVSGTMLQSSQTKKSI